MYLYPENLPAGSMPKPPRLHMTTKGVPHSWEISQPDENDEGTDISRYSSLGAPDIRKLKKEKRGERSERQLEKG